MQGLLASSALYGTKAFSQQSSRSSGDWLLVGTGHGEGIYRARWTAQSGEIGAPELALPTPQPSFLARHPHLPVVYACNESDTPVGGVTACTLTASTASLHELRTQPSQGQAPCFVSVDRTGKLLFAANYSSGSLAAFPLDSQGKPGPASGVFACAGNSFCGAGGPVKDRQAGPHLHCAVLSPDNRFVLACDLGDDALLVFPIHPGAASPLGGPVRVPTQPGAGPRHLAFHPNGRWLYCINELDCIVVAYTWERAAGRAVPFPDSTRTIRSASAPAGHPSTGAEIAITHDGRFAYTSTRFVDVLTVFAVDPATGALTQRQQLPCGGKTPRFFALDPTERWLLCANQDSDTVSVFARDAGSGQLTPKAAFPAPNPQCLLWL